MPEMRAPRALIRHWRARSARRHAALSRMVQDITCHTLFVLAPLFGVIHPICVGHMMPCSTARPDNKICAKG